MNRAIGRGADRRRVERPPREGPRAREVGLDGGVISAALLLAGIGAVMIFSITAPKASPDDVLPPFFLRQGEALLAGVVLAGLAAALPLRVWHALALPLWGATALSLVAVLFVGIETNGARRWLGVESAGLVLQPGEFAKFTSVLAASALLARRDARSGVAPLRILAALGLAAVPAGLLLLQPDLGNAVLLCALVGLVLFVAGVSLRLLVAPAVLGAVGIAAYVAANPYALNRVIGFLHPWATAHSQGYQLVQSFVAFGRGGFFGVGVGGGMQKLHYLPEAHTDFVLAVVAEELGLAGVLVVLGAFAALLVAGVRIALRARQRFAMLLAFGMTALLVVPAVLNGAVVMGLVPTKGLTLPFLSYGRSSVLASCLALGVVLGIGRREARPGTPAIGKASPRGVVP
ncbi:MAG TPA: putative peptidoglycan glycosyltransferase FtsW [Myxococcota bacterium]|jgi:cell division protein FtsW|nr:putative peptidoglycan glycosyltransferase FtsW [Myxococcota bacterium]